MFGNASVLKEVFSNHRIDTIVHFAGSIIVSESVADPLTYYRNNTLASHCLITAAISAKIPNIIFSSTAAVYGIPETIPIPESAPLNPISPYGSSKLMTETMLRDCARAHRLNVAALRYFNVAGADPRGRTGQASKNATHLIKIACETASGKRPFMDVFGTDYPTDDGTCVRDYIHVTDLALAHLEVVRYLRQGGDSTVFNCGYASGYSVLEVIETVKRVSGNDFVVRVGARRPGDPAVLVSDNAKLLSTLRWRPQYNDLDQIVAHALAWENALGRSGQTNLSTMASPILVQALPTT